MESDNDHDEGWFDMEEEDDARNEIFAPFKGGFVNFNGDAISTTEVDPN